MRLSHSGAWRIEWEAEVLARSCGLRRTDDQEVDNGKNRDYDLGPGPEGE